MALPGSSMNQETFEQFELSKDMVEGAEGYPKRATLLVSSSLSPGQLT